MKQSRSSKGALRAFAALALALVLYIGGLRLLLVPVVLVCMAYWMPFPAMFRSLCSRLVASTLLLLSFIQVAALLQFFLLPNTGLITLAVVIAGMTAGLVVWFDDNRKHARQIFIETKDIAAAGAALLFIVPFMYVCFADGSLVGIGQVAGIQSSDAVNHFMAINEMAEQGHLTYRTVDYYPKGFHLAVAFMQDTMGLNQPQLSWANNARMFVAEYIVWGGLLAYVLFYLCRVFFDAVGGRLSRWNDAALAMALGVPLSLLYLLPFTYQGFLNYFYVCAAFVLGLLYLYGFHAQMKTVGETHARWFIVGYLLLSFGIGMSWPLLTPPLVLVAGLYVLPRTWRLRENVRYIRERRNWPVLAGFALQLVPLYLHVRYSALTAEQGLTAQGSIRAFHYGVLLAGLVLVTYLATNKRFTDGFKQLVTNAFQPFYFFVTVIAVWHFIRVGELRYYAIKVGYLIELLILAAGVAVVVELYARGTLSRIHKLAVPALTVTVTMLLLVGLNGNPLKDVREMFRDVSQFGTPAFYDSDVRKFTDLGVGGVLDNANNTVVHYDAQSNHLYGNMLVANWANIMQHRQVVDQRALRCSGKLFPIAMYREVSPEQQNDFIRKMRECIQITEAAGREYYIVTDNASVPKLRELFGDRVQIVAH